MDNHTNDEPLATRRQELLALVRGAFQRTAEKVIRSRWFQRPALPESDRMFLQDASRGRRPATPDNVARLMALQDGHVLSEELRNVEAAGRPVPCFTEATDKETETNGSLDAAQILAEREKSPARWQQVVDAGLKQLEATRELVDAAYLKLRSVS